MAVNAENLAPCFAVCARWFYISGMMPIPQLAPPDSVSRYTGGGVPKGAVMIVVCTLIYGLPTMLAWKRESSRRWKITAIKLLGWTVIGWIVAMVMTYAYEPPPPGSEPDRERVPGEPRGDERR